MAAYWIYAFILLQQTPWRAQYTSNIVFAALCGLFVELLLGEDVAATLLQLVPIYIDVSVLVCPTTDGMAGRKE